jgi:hypothetical protein
MNDVVSSKTRLLRLALSAVGFFHIYRLECGGIELQEYLS